MSGIILRWGVPALLTVVGGTALALSTTSNSMSESLAARAAEAISTEDAGWASVSFESRDAVLLGTASDQATINAAAQKVAAIHGVRSVRSEMVVAEQVSPYPFAATLADGEVRLSGGVPDESLRAVFSERTNADGSSLRLLTGAPQRALWQPAVEYGLGFIEHFDEGEMVLVDLDLTITGRAKSPEAFDALNQLASDVPEAVRLAELDLVPPLASPFTWQASFDGDKVAVSGFTPSESLVEELQTAALGGHPLSTSLRLASGAPTNFEISARAMLESLVLLEDGTARISDESATLAGSPPDVATAERVRAAMTRIGAQFDLAPPRVAAYTFIAERQGEGIALSGHIPDEALRERLTELEGVDATALELARGAPDRFESGIDFGLDLLSHMSEGRFAIDGTSLSISGRAATVADFEDVETALSLGPPQGLILALGDVRPPLADPFTWSAAKGAAGGVTFSGYVPSTAARNRLHTAAINVGGDSTIIADGAPENFESEAGNALALLLTLETGSISYDGANWAITGKVASSDAALAADQAFARSGLREAGWAFDIDAPPPPEPPPPPLVDPYVWRAEKAATGTTTLTGAAPSEELQRALFSRAGAGATDESTLGLGQPENFDAAALAGMDALVRLSQGAVSYDGREWSLSGEVASVGERLLIEDTLEAAVDTSNWQIAIQALDAPPVVTPYAWSATKTADGALTLAGYVATEELQRFIAVRAGDATTDTTAVASGEPAGFIADVLAGLEALTHLAEGTASLEQGVWTLSGVPQTAADAERAIAALGTTEDGRWVMDLSDPVTVATEDPAAETVDEEAVEPPVARDFTFAVTKPLDGALVLEGNVPNVGAGAYLGVLAGGVPTDRLAVADGMPGDFAANSLAGARLLSELASGEFGLEGETWVLSGSAETEADRSAMLQRLAETPLASNWQTRIDLLPPLDACRRKVAAFAGRNAILFHSGSARLAEASNAAIDELAEYLKVCPDAVVHVEGHTDADGAEDLNLALSVARAEMVVEALIERGVSFQRLYAVGYGESLPVADNDTSAGKRANRRIAFTILDEHL